MILQCHPAASESGKQRHHQRSTGHSFKPGDVAIDPLARQRDRLTAIGRRRSVSPKKKSGKKKFVFGASVPPGGERIREAAAPPAQYRPFVQAQRAPFSLDPSGRQWSPAAPILLKRNRRAAAGAGVLLAARGFANGQIISEIGERESPPVYPLQFECEPNNGGIVYLSRGRKRRFA